jgi:hypothetical protein
MVDAPATYKRNVDVPWVEFSTRKYWQDNYAAVQPEDHEIIDRVSRFFASAFGSRGKVQCAIDVGTGPNLYPALLMLPWTDRILLTDYSEGNLGWLRQCVLDDSGPWPWQSFWREIDKRAGYDQVAEPRKSLKEACTDRLGYSGIERRSVFDLPPRRWQLGTMFFVAESITSDIAEFRSAVGCFLGALADGAPFAAAFMGGSTGYKVDGKEFPALPVSREDVADCLVEFGASGLDVCLLQTSHRVRKGYNGMLVATGIVGSR